MFFCYSDFSFIAHILFSTQKLEPTLPTMLFLWQLCVRLWWVMCSSLSAHFFLTSHSSSETLKASFKTCSSTLQHLEMPGDTWIHTLRRNSSPLTCHLCLCNFLGSDSGRHTDVGTWTERWRLFRHEAFILVLIGRPYKSFCFIMTEEIHVSWIRIFLFYNSLYWIFEVS